MILITTALMIEARPLVRRLALTASPEEPFPVFIGEERVMVVTGSGSLKAAAATAWAFARFPGIRGALNIGFAGADASIASLHSWHLVHSVRDESTRRLFVPDILYRHPFPELPLLTVPRVVREPIPWKGLVDMEGSGFMEAARRFLPTDRLALLKWVSDHLTGAIERTATENAFAGSLDPVFQFMLEWPASFGEDGEKTNPAVESMAQRLRLTETQYRFFRKWLLGYLARGGDPARVEKLLPDTPPKAKSENRRLLEEVKHVLKG